MVKTNAQRVREAEASHRAQGEKQIRVWVPNQPEPISLVRELAKKLCLENAAKKTAITD